MARRAVAERGVAEVRRYVAGCGDRNRYCCLLAGAVLVIHEVQLQGTSIHGELACDLMDHIVSEVERIYITTDGVSRSCILTARFYRKGEVVVRGICRRAIVMADSYDHGSIHVAERRAALRRSYHHVQATVGGLIHGDDQVEVCSNREVS